MEHHAAYGLDLESLDIVIVDDSKTVLAMIRSMISSLKVGRVRTFDRGDLALQAIMHEPPNVIFTDLAMSPMSGMQLLRLVRQRTMEPLCFIPVIVVTAHATQQRVAQLFEVGAHHVLAKPTSSIVLQNRLKSLTSDPRMMRLEKERYVIDGMREALMEKQKRLRTLEKARQFHEQTVPRAQEKQRRIDKILDTPAGIIQPQEMEQPEAKQIYLSRGARIAESLRNKDGSGKGGPTLPTSSGDQTRSLSGSSRRFAGVKGGRR